MYIWYKVPHMGYERIVCGVANSNRFCLSHWSDIQLYRHFIRMPPRTIDQMLDHYFYVHVEFTKAKHYFTSVYITINI